MGTPPQHDEGRSRVDHRHLELRLRMESELVARRHVLPLGDDSIRAVDVAAHEVLQDVIGVQPTPPLSHLRDPATPARLIDDFEEQLHPEVDFGGATAVQLHGRSAVAEGFRRLKPIIARNELKDLVVEGNKAFVLYDFVTDTPVGPVLTGELWLRNRSASLANDGQSRFAPKSGTTHCFIGVSLPASNAAPFPLRTRAAT